ncbi:MAG: FAD-binding oxidoreductase [Candidatus Asgardarchaeia archaeon]
MIPKNFIEELVGILGEKNVSTKLRDKIIYSKDAWVIPIIKFYNLEKLSTPDAIVWPENTQQVSEILKLANKYKIPVIPYGGGAGVTGAALPSRGSVILDLKKMNKVIRVDTVSQVAVTQTGIIGDDFEEIVNRYGFTLGHIPMSFYTSTIGGFLATRASGILSTKYGNIEDMVLGLEVVLPNGEIIRTKPVPKASNGPDLNRLFIGSEGTLGIITEATLKLNKLPEERRFIVYIFEKVEDGLDTIRELLQMDVVPAITRLYDEYDTLVILSRIGISAEGNLLILMIDGIREKVELEEKIIAKVCKKHGGKELDPKIGEHWWKHRHNQYFELPEILDAGFADTIEVAATWDRLKDLYFKIREALEDEIMIMAHFSHAYKSGCAIYFTFVGDLDEGENKFATLRHVWDTIMHITNEVGGTFSHHHGVGIARNPWMRQELGKSLDLLKQLKRALDPNNILNPGKLGLDGVDWPR